MVEIKDPPRGVFKGQNFMTPDPVAYYVTKVNGLVAYVEVSKGFGLSRRAHLRRDFSRPARHALGRRAFGLCRVA